ncbi:hypothetical protein ACIA48_27460 [Mycobacterium sp. NPDC051804]|uniref:hypothetical protein n=1 Tax=Mycobacterium sp. NPDC051804 TaxID=3364295 RepID=UPI003797666D
MAAVAAVRTAVVVVHGMGEKRPLETFEGFVRTALYPRDGKWQYSPRPTAITESYEARRFSSPQYDFFEYYWQFLMSADKFAGVAPTLLRLFLRRPSNVPDALLGVWRLVWATILAALLVIPVLFVSGYALNSDVPVWIIGLVTSAVVLIFWFGLYRMMARALVNKTTAPLVESARYLDPSPTSYTARRAIRAGLVELLDDLHDDEYERIVVVAHGVGTYISYDALMVYQAKKQWRITDFITIGAPLSLADLLMTRPSLSSGLKLSDGAVRRELFDGLLRRGALLGRPSIDGLEGDPLDAKSPFAVMNWTNFWFPVTRGSRRGDWFGGALAPLFGAGIRDIAVTGNEPERLKPGLAHAEYFSHPDEDAEGDIAWHLRRTLAL